MPTYQRQHLLDAALDALLSQELGEPFELVVVDDEASEATRELVEARAATTAVPLRYLATTGRRGPAHARNLGWRAASAPLVAFTDDDCRPSPRWAEALLGAAGDGVFVQGRTEPDPDEVHLLGGLARSQSITEPNEIFQTCNMAYPRDLLERLGGFDETLATDDTDLAWRARAAGAEAVWAPDALVWHAVFPRHVPQAIAETWRWRHVPALLARHPDQRRLLRYGFFWKETHARLTLAAAGALAARTLAGGGGRGRRTLADGGGRRRRRALAAALATAAATPYAALHARAYDATPRGLARAALDLPSLAAVDAAETVLTAAGGIRHGAPMA